MALFISNSAGSGAGKHFLIAADILGEISCMRIFSAIRSEINRPTHKSNR